MTAIIAMAALACHSGEPTSNASRHLVHARQHGNASQRTKSGRKYLALQLVRSHQYAIKLVGNWLRIDTLLLPTTISHRTESTPASTLPSNEEGFCVIASPGTFSVVQE